MTQHHFANKRREVHRATLRDYLEHRKAKRLGVPQSSWGKGFVGNSFISEETGIPAQILEETKVHQFILRYVKEIGFSEQLPGSPDKPSNNQSFYTHQVMLYLDRLRDQGRKVPEHPVGIGRPYLEKIAGECSIPFRALRVGMSARAALGEGIKELGLEVYVNDPVWTKLTYAQLLERGGLLRADELEGKAHAGQQRYNTISALRAWMRNLGLSAESLVGPELSSQFDEKLEQAKLSIKSIGSKSKFSSEMRHWVALHRELLRRNGLPADFRAALEMAIERSGLNSQRVGELADGVAGVIGGWLKGQALPSKSSFPFVSRIENVLKLDPGSLTSLIAHRRSKRFRLTDYPEFTLIGGTKIPLRDNGYLLK
jgi:hypothetical protein